VGYPELLRVLEEEAAREAREIRAAARREAARIVEEAERTARAASEALLARERREAEGRRRAALDGLAIDRERSLLFERRKLLDELRGEAVRRLAASGTPELDARLLAEVLPDAGGGDLEIVVDPGAEEAARAAFARLAPGRRATVRAAPERRGGIEVTAGRRVLDDTLPSRVDRAWPDVEAELAALLLEER
jgi:V/A-type H+/Na+-transporting ATPase subunit E